MNARTGTVGLLLAACTAAAPAAAQVRVEFSKDGHQVVTLSPAEAEGRGWVKRGSSVPFGTTPDWSNNIRRQVGGLQVADMNGNGWNDVVVGCYISQSFPPYPEWRNLIYFNTGGQLEADPSWQSADEVSTGDIQVGDINGNGHLDIFSANGGTAMAPSVIYFGGPGGPNPTPGWVSQEPTATWNNYALLFDIDHDGDLDVITANQGLSPQPFRPMYLFRNHDGVLETVPSWQSDESSIQNFLAAADYDGDGWEDIAVSKWANFETGIYRNIGGNLQTVPAWTTGATTSDKGVAWADVTGNGWPDLALGRNPTTLYTNDNGTLSLGWQATGTFFGHSELRFFDVDGDGFDDLIEIHFSTGQARIYMNNNGVLDSTPSWEYDAPEVGTALALGDINGDGRPDLVLGFSGDVSLRVFYAQAPECPEDIDGDGEIGLSDLSILLSNFGTIGGAGPEDGDINGDGNVDLADLSLLLEAFGTGCG